jgi:putative zinc finger protein
VSEHLTAGQIESYDKRLMSSAELLVALDHLALCEPCREQFNPEHKIRVIGGALRKDLGNQAIDSNHLSFEESAAYVDGCLSGLDREIVESHLDLCSPCATEITDLRAFRAEMTTYPEIERVPTRSSTRKIFSFWRPAALRLPIQLAAAASVVLLCVLIATILLRKDNANRDTQVSELQKPNEQPAPQTPPGTPVDPLTLPRQNTGTTAPGEPADEIRDGRGIVTLDKHGNIAGLETLPLSYQQAVRARLTKKRADRPSELNDLVGKAGVLMGGGSAGMTFALIGPIGTVVKTDRPTFRWRAFSGATSYVVTVYDSNFNKVGSSGQQPGTEWTMPQKLERGGLYSWQVAAITEGKEVLSPTPPAPDAKFKVLEPSRMRELERAGQAFVSSHLVLGILYERAGLLDDAEREFNTLYRANPKSPTVRKLLHDVKSLRAPK